MASVQTSSYSGRYLKLTVYEESYSIANNTSTIRWTLESIGGSSQYYSIYNCSVVVNGQTVYNSGTTSWSSKVFPAATGSTSGTITVGHNADGTAGDVGFTLHGRVYYSGDENKSGSIGLTRIPRYSNISSADNFNDESNPSITFTNPSGGYFSLKAKMEAGGNSQLITRTLDSRATSCTFNLSESERNTLRNLCKSSNTLAVRFTICCMSGSSELSASYLDRTMTIVNGNPTFSSSNISYKDNNSTTVNVTGNNQQLVQNLSKLLVTITSATAKKSATISKYDVTVNNTTKSVTSAGNIDFGTINSSNNLTLSVKVTDSRGNTTTATKTVTFLEWSLPSAIISLKRKNNYENETYLLVDASYSSVNNKNKISITYAYKKTTESSYCSPIAINDNTKVIMTKDKESAWNYQIIIKDKFGTTTYNVILPKGKFILFVDTKKLSVGINCFPTQSESLEVNGIEVLDYDVISTW